MISLIVEEVFSIKSPSKFFFLYEVRKSLFPVSEKRLFFAFLNSSLWFISDWEISRDYYNSLF